MRTLATIDDDKLHGLIYRLAQRRRAGDLATGELLGKFLDEADRRGDLADVDEPPLEPEALLAWGLGLRRTDRADGHEKATEGRSLPKRHA